MKRALIGQTRDFLEVVLPACASGRVADVRDYLRDERDFARWIGPHGRTMLWEAARKGQLEVVRLLAEEASADVDAIGCYYRETRLEVSPWLVARLNGHDSVVNYLESRGAGCDLLAACYLADHGRVEEILADDPEAAERPYDRDIRWNAYRAWPLQYAIISGDTDIVRMLLDAGARADAHPRILFDAVDTERYELVDMLLATGAAPHSSHGRCWVDDPRALELARRHGHVLDPGDAPPEKWPRLVDECRGNHNAPDDPARIRSLIAGGADVHVRDYKAKTALHRAAQADFVKITGYLLKHGADVDARDEKLQTPLFDAAFHGRVNSLTALLEAGADIEAADDRGETCVFAAVRGGSAATLEILHTRGARLDLPNDKGKTPLDVAMRSRKRGIEQVREYFARADVRE